MATMYVNEYGTIFAVYSHTAEEALDLYCLPDSECDWKKSGVLAAVKGEATSASELQGVLDKYAGDHNWRAFAADDPGSPLAERMVRAFCSGNLNMAPGDVTRQVLKERFENRIAGGTISPGPGFWAVSSRGVKLRDAGVNISYTYSKFAKYCTELGGVNAANPPEEVNEGGRDDYQPQKADAQGQKDAGNPNCPFYAVRSYSDNAEGHFCHLCGSLKRAHRTCLGKYKDDWHKCNVFVRYNGEERRRELERENTGAAVEESSQPTCVCAGCRTIGCTCAGGHRALGRKYCDGEQNCAQSGCTYEARKAPDPTDAAATSTSSVATAAADQTVVGPEASEPGSSMMVAPAAKNSEPAGVASENALAGADGSTAFDYSGLDDQTVADLHLAEREYSSGKKMAEMGLRRMADAVAIAHDVLVANCEGHNQHSEDTFSAWCQSIGLKKDSAYRMLQVSKLMDGSSPREQKVLEELSPSLLYAAAKPSAPAELVQAVKDGDITTHKQYQEALAEIKARDAKIQELLEMSENSDRRADQAEAKAKKAEQERDAARDAQANLSAMANKFSKQRDAAEQRVEDAEHRAEEAERRAQAAEEDAAEKDKRIRELETGRPQTIEATVVERIRMPEMAEEDAAELTTNLAASVTTVQRSFFMAAAAMAPQVKARCANTLWDTVNELATLLAASANPSYEEEEATPFD